MRLMMGVLAVALMSGICLGALQTETQTLYYNNEVLDMSKTFTFDQFDDNGGLHDLQYVQISFNICIDQGGFIADNDSQNPAAFNYTYNLVGGLSSSDVVIMPTVGVLITETDSLSLAADNGDGPGVIDGTGPDGVTIDITGKTATNAQTITNSAFLPDYIGSGTYDILATSSRTFDLGGASGVEGGYTVAVASGCVTVLYCYEVVPEPMTMGLLGLGVVGLLRKRLA